MTTKIPQENQNYQDDYWETIFEYTKIQDEGFVETLRIPVGIIF